MEAEDAEDEGERRSDVSIEEFLRDIPYEQIQIELRDWREENAELK